MLECSRVLHHPSNCRFPSQRAVRFIACCSLLFTGNNNLPQNWKLERRKVEAFLTAAEQAYGRDNPYHNSTHAADVVQAAFIMLRSVQQPQFTKLEVRCSCCRS